MTPYIEEAQRLLRLARRDYQTCAISASHPEAQIAPICFHAQQPEAVVRPMISSAGMPGVQA